MFRQLGIDETLRARIVQALPGVPVATLIARGEVELGFQQTSEMINAPGIELLGPLPVGLQLLTRFSAAATSWARNRTAIAQLLAFMTSGKVDSVKRQFGMEP